MAAFGPSGGAAEPRLSMPLAASEALIQAPAERLQLRAPAQGTIRACPLLLCCHRCDPGFSRIMCRTTDSWMRQCSSASLTGRAPRWIGPRLPRSRAAVVAALGTPMMRRRNPRSSLRTGLRSGCSGRLPQEHVWGLVWSGPVCSGILVCSVLFCSVLFCSVLFCSVLFCSVLFCSVLFCSVLF